MKVKWETKSDKMPEMQVRIKEINDTAIEAGVIEGKHKWLAGIHEYGCNITVTPAMRAYLHSQGLHLNPKTTEIHIPERSFIRTGYDNWRERGLRNARLLLPDVVNGTLTLDQLKEEIGKTLIGEMKVQAKRTAPNHPFTVDRKGSDTPLADGGDMIEGINYRDA